MAARRLEAAAGAPLLFLGGGGGGGERERERAVDGVLQTGAVAGRGGGREGGEGEAAGG